MSYVVQTITCCGLETVVVSFLFDMCSQKALKLLAFMTFFNSLAGRENQILSPERVPCLFDTLSRFSLTGLPRESVSFDGLLVESIIAPATSGNGTIVCQ